MKAIVYTNYGAPDVLQLEEIEKPIPKDNEVLIKVDATTVNATDCVFRKGEPLLSRLFTGLTKPKKQILGSEFAEQVEAAGKGIKLLKAGDNVFGTTPGYGSNQEYICLPEEGKSSKNAIEQKLLRRNRLLRWIFDCSTV